MVNIHLTLLFHLVIYDILRVMMLLLNFESTRPKELWTKQLREGASLSFPPKPPYPLIFESQSVY
jgi:hypothetical protein